VSERIGVVAAIYAALYATIKDWLRGFYGPATPSFASGFVCLLVTLNLSSIIQATNSDLAYRLITEWRNAALVTLIVAFTVVDLALVETGKADRWASAAFDRFDFLSHHRGKLVITLIAITLVGFILSIQLAKGQ
jgi:hypothetical protein